MYLLSYRTRRKGSRLLMAAFMFGMLSYRYLLVIVNEAERGGLARSYAPGFLVKELQKKKRIYLNVKKIIKY